MATIPTKYRVLSTEYEVPTYLPSFTEPAHLDMCSPLRPWG